MPRFLFIGEYTPQATKAIIAAGGTARRAAIERMATEVGGRLETFHFAFGTDDVYAIAELPDARTAAAMALTVNSSGVARVRTVVLMTPEEVDEAVRLQPTYQPPTG
ncbi:MULTISPECIES: GYD domain-containing protein [unclassified Geodermatophilus]